MHHVQAGEEPVGVAATCDPAVIRALAADCVLYMARTFAVDDVVGLLESGTNVVTTRGEYWLEGVDVVVSDPFDLAPVKHEATTDRPLLVMPEPRVGVPLRIARRPTRVAPPNLRASVIAPVS